MADITNTIELKARKMGSSCDNCKHCEKKGLLVLPLRYGVVTNTEKTKVHTSLLSAKGLGKGVTDIELTHSSYAARMMRKGYLYILVDKTFEQGTFRFWQSYLVLPEGPLFRFNPQDPPTSLPPVMCNRSGKKMHAYMVSFEDPEKVDNAWFLFTPSLMADDKLHEYSQNPDLLVKENKIQHFSPKKWVNGTKTQPHTIEAEMLPDLVPEFKPMLWGELGPDSELAKGLRSQLFPAIPATFEPSVKFSPPNQCEGVLGGIYRDLKEGKGAAIALFDHIGITQELNHFRNDALLPIHVFQEGKDRHYVSNDWKLTVSSALDDARDVYIKQKSAAAAAKVEDTKKIIAAGKPGVVTTNATVNLHHIEADYEREKKSAAKKWDETYLKKLDEKELTNFRKDLRNITKQAEADVTARARDHRKWVESARLVDAFDVYSKINLGCGFSFRAHQLLCMDGMFGEKSNQDLLVKWWSSDEIERSNLYQRANLFNSESLEKQASQTFRETAQASVAAGGMAYVEGKLVTKAVKGVVDTVRKCDSAWDEWLRDGQIKSLHSASPDATKYAAVVDDMKKKLGAKLAQKYIDLSDANKWMKGPFLSSRIAEFSLTLTLKPTPFDKAMQGRVGAMIYFQLGDLINEMSHEELIGKMPAHIAADPDKRKIAEKAHEKEVADYKKKVEKSGDVLVEDENAKRAKRMAERQGKIRDYIERLQTGEPDGKGGTTVPRPETNNLRQVRMLNAILAIEFFGLLLKAAPGNKYDAKAGAEILASVLTLTATSIDIRYGMCKAFREIPPYKDMKFADKAADIARGKLKFMSGVLSSGAGFISSYLDATKSLDEFQKKNPDLILGIIYISRSAISFAAAYTGYMAAYSYTGVALKWAIEKKLWWSSVTRIGIGVSVAGADSVKLARTLWLLRVARFNMLGLVLTGAELVYTLAIKDDALENWLQACVFRKQKKQTFFTGERPYLSEEQEMAGLENALKEILGVKES